MSALPNRVDRDGSYNPNEERQVRELQERRKRLHEITQETRYELIQTILMHPEQLPSLAEIDYMHPDRSKSTLREHLENLMDLGILQKVELPKEKQSRDQPRIFYGLNDKGRDILEELGLLDIEETLQFLYQNMEKPDYILELENAPRPD